MRATRAFSLGMATILLSVVSGCTTEAPPAPVSDRPARTLRVFIETFEDAPDSPGSGSTFTPIFAMAVHRVAASVNAQYIQAGNKESAEAVITGRITVWEDGGWTKQATVGFDA